MPIVSINDRKFDARPDRIDYRDRVYQPPLVSLPEQYPDPKKIKQFLKDYTETHQLILDQGKEGSCTGFGLAAVINYLLYTQHLNGHRAGKAVPLKKVSPRMLYQMAKVYDEWQGEDYEGSSCRGAMKGWHRHGVCLEEKWPYSAEHFERPKPGWEQDAAHRPLGAYYRVNKDSIADMQAAIYEVGAIYVSAKVHKGWFLEETTKLPVIKLTQGETGGHAFAITGYNSQGFVVQNSWSPKWGYFGFALLTYEDWIQHGTDAWTAVLGAPMETNIAVRTRSSKALKDIVAGKAAWFWSSDVADRKPEYKNKAVQPFDENKAYEHTVVFGNDGRPLNRFLDLEKASDAVQETAFNLPLNWLKDQQTPRIAIYAHGGLNNEEASIKRIRVMAPYFVENGVYPLFITWRTGFQESIAGMLKDAVNRFFLPSETEPARGWATELKRRLADAKDRSIEVACEQLLVKPIWVQMKQNAAASIREGAGLSMVAQQLEALQKQIPELEIHFVGHSAGSILLGHLLDDLPQKQLKVRTCSLFAPACTVDFALSHYVPALKAGTLVYDGLHFDILSDEREQADSVGPYGKSLLYLVSRALEQSHKTPILGMEGVWHKRAESQDMWNKLYEKQVTSWRNYASEINEPKIHESEQISDGHTVIPLAHGSFDNDVEVISNTLSRIIGGKLSAEIENLHGF
ncbi:MAG: C1 family peptidase [Gammaproteobacteria bacterium]